MCFHRELCRIARQAREAVAAVAHPDGNVMDAVLDAFFPAGIPRCQDSNVEPLRGQPPVDFMRADGSAASTRHGGVLKSQVQYPHDVLPLSFVILGRNARA